MPDVDYVWANASKDGNRNSLDHCQRWNSESASFAGGVGLTLRTIDEQSLKKEWTAVGSNGKCSASFPLICAGQ